MDRLYFHDFWEFRSHEICEYYIKVTRRNEESADRQRQWLNRKSERAFYQNQMVLMFEWKLRGNNKFKGTIRSTIPNFTFFQTPDFFPLLKTKQNTALPFTMVLRIDGVSS